MNMFGAISDIQVDTLHREARFSYEDIKLHLHDSIVEVDQAVIGLEQYIAASAQLEATIASIESMKGMVDEQVMCIVNRDNQLGKLFGIYIPESLRFEMADENTTANAKPSAATTDEKQKTGQSVTEKAKEVVGKMWEMLKTFFAKIAHGLKSFWQWLVNGFMSNKASNEKLLAAIQADTDGSKLTEALKQAQGFITFGEAQKAMNASANILKAPFVEWMRPSDCSAVMDTFDKNSIWNTTVDKLLGIDEATLKDAWIRVIASGDGGLLPAIELDKSQLKNLKTNKGPLSAKQWDGVRDGLIAIIQSMNNYYQSVSDFEPPKFIELASKFDWENSEYGKKNTDHAMTKKKCQAVCKFYTQWNKIVLACTDTVQAHLNAIKKYMNVDAGGQRTAQPNPEQGATQAANQAAQTPQA